MAENNGSSQAIKILIVDDHPAVREALCTRISLHPDLTTCGQAAEVVEALRLCAETKPSIVITDISLKKSDGIDLIKRIKAREPEMRILVWSMHDERVYAERAMRAGANGYITKEQATEQIIDAIRQVLSGRVYLSPLMREFLLARTTDNGGRDQYRTPTDQLTDRELEVFRLIGEGKKTQDIAEQLHVSVKTVETHRDRIKKKLHLKDANELLRRAVLWVTNEI